MDKREIALSSCRVAGYHNDKMAFTRAYIDNRLSIAAANEAWQQGVKQRESGLKCNCSQCREGD